MVKKDAQLMQKENIFKNSNYYRLLVIVLAVTFLLLSINSASGFYENTNTSVLQNSSLVPATRSSHLIEVDLSHENAIFVQESIVFSVSLNVSEIPDNLAINVPGSAEIDSFQRVEMMGTGSEPINYTRDGDILYFDDSKRLQESSLPAIYEIRYVIKDNAAISYRSFSKVLHSSEQVFYPIGRLTVAVSHPEGVHVHLTNEIGNAIKADTVETNVNIVTFAWNNPDIAALTVNTHSPVEQSSDGNVPVAFLFLLAFGAVVVVVYMLYSKRKGNAGIRELEDQYESLLTVILQIEDDHKSKILSDKEFLSLHKKYKSQAMDIKKKIDSLQK